MNKLLKNLILIVLISTSISAVSQIHFGGRTGLNISFLSTQPKMEDYDLHSTISPKSGLGLAALGYFELGPYIAIQPELVYNRKGLKTKLNEYSSKDKDTLIVADWNYTFDYFELPLMIKLSLNSEGFDPFIEFGAYYGYLLKARYRAYATANNSSILDQDYTSDFKTNSLGETLDRHEYGFKVGIGGTLEVSKGIVFFSIRYSQGLKDMIKYELKPANYQKTYNRVFQITVGYAFELRSNNSDKIFYY